MSDSVFITDDFLLENKCAQRLYHEYAAGMPILDFHSHLSPQSIASDGRWGNLAQIWLSDDHYKWRAMRSNGVPERFCTGNASDWEKFDQWAATVPFLLRNPLYDWTHLELARYFDISDRLLCRETAVGVWDETGRKLALPEFSCRALVKKARVTHICTTDDPVDSLTSHAMIAADESFGAVVLPTWRPDRALAIENVAEFNAWTDKLAAAADVEIRDFNSYIGALRKRHAFFHRAGCRLADHALDMIDAAGYTDKEVEAVFAKARSGMAPDAEGFAKFRSAMMYEFGIMNHEKGWTQQFHIGAMRCNSTRAALTVVPNTGADSIGDSGIARPLSRLLDRLDRTDQLAKTILYNINPRDNALL
ncbi:MAG: glucuronate isomerase, partial [bacterium]